VPQPGGGSHLQHGRRLILAVQQPEVGLHRLADRPCDLNGVQRAPDGADQSSAETLSPVGQRRLA
jgi:hypothetical protein